MSEIKSGGEETGESGAAPEAPRELRGVLDAMEIATRVNAPYVCVEMLEFRRWYSVLAGLTDAP